MIDPHNPHHVSLHCWTIEISTRKKPKRPANTPRALPRQQAGIAQPRRYAALRGKWPMHAAKRARCATHAARRSDTNVAATTLVPVRSFACHRCQPRIGRAADRMVDHRERVVRHPQHAAHQLGGTDEPRRHHRDGGNAQAFGSNGVMQTARRAAASVADAGNDRVPVGDLAHDVAIGRRAVVRLHAADDVGDAELLAQHPVEMGEETLRPFLAVGDEANGLASQRARPRRSCPSGGAVSFVGSRTWKAMPYPSLKRQIQRFGGSQSTQAPIAIVTAWLLCPSHGGMTAPNPPAGPPAATTSRWSGDSSAG